jgi:hypothetical protein
LGEVSLPVQAPRGGCQRPWVGLGVVALLALWGVSSLYYTVQPEERAVVKRFGKVVKINDPGLHFKLPFGIDRVQIRGDRTRDEAGVRLSHRGSEDERIAYSTEDFPDESLMLSGDLNIIDVEWVVQYRIGDPMKYPVQHARPRPHPARHQRVGDAPCGGQPTRQRGADHRARGDRDHSRVTRSRRR